VGFESDFLRHSHITGTNELPPPSKLPDRQNQINEQAISFSLLSLPMYYIFSTYTGKIFMVDKHATGTIVATN
jgi:hypothetical protein